jgi:hypothetical protein
MLIEEFADTVNFWIGHSLMEIAQRGDMILKQNSGQLLLNQSFAGPQAVNDCPIEWYFVLLTKSFGVDPDEQSIAILILIERLCNNLYNKGKALVVNSLNIHRYVSVNLSLKLAFYLIPKNKFSFFAWKAS